VTLWARASIWPLTNSEALGSLKGMVFSLICSLHLINYPQAQGEGSSCQLPQSPPIRFAAALYLQQLKDLHSAESQLIKNA
jgi:hypothetical protein